MEQAEEVKKPNLHPMRERAAARAAHDETKLITFETEKVKIDQVDSDPDDAFVIRLVLDVVAGRSDRSLFDEAGDLKEGCQSSALLAVAEGLMRSFNSDLSVKGELMLKLSMTAISAEGYEAEPDEFGVIHAQERVVIPEAEELDYSTAIEETAEPGIKEITLQDASKAKSQSNQFIIKQSTSEQESEY